jgi:large conductance mechanosensitive channel
LSEREVPAGTALEAAKKIDGVNLLTYGNFVTSFISFLILAFVLFLVINKFMTALKNKLEKPVDRGCSRPQPRCRAPH